MSIIPSKSNVPEPSSSTSVIIASISSSDISMSVSICKKKNLNILVEDSFRLLVKRNVPVPSISLNIPYFSQTGLYIFYKKKVKK